MKVIGLGKVHKFIEKHAHAKSPVAAWLAEARAAEWTSRAAVHARFGSRVDFTSQGNAVFRLGGKKYRLVVVIAFRSQTVSVVWIGTHAEYNGRQF